MRYVAAMLPKIIIRLLPSLLVIAAATTCAAEEPKIDPQVQALMDRYLRVDPTYSPGDILSRSQVEPIYNDLIARGLQPTRDPESAYTPILRDTHFLVMLLRTPQGRAFMKKIAGTPPAYDHLDRLSWLPGGQTWVRQIVGSEQGPELLEQLFSEAGLQALKQQFAADGQSEMLDRPTGKIYTEAALGVELTKSLRKQLLAKSKAATAKNSGSDAKRSSTATSAGGAKPKRPAGA